MRWVLEDLLTLGSVVLEGRGEWIIGCEKGADSTVLAPNHNVDKKISPENKKRKRISLPVGSPQDKIKTILDGNLAYVSGDHGILGADRKGLYYIDCSSNYTLLSDRKNEPCKEKIYLRDGERISLAGTYNLRFSKIGFLHSFGVFLKNFWYYHLQPY